MPLRHSAIVALLLGLLGSPLIACSLCSSIISQCTLSEELQRAHVVVYGTLANPMFSQRPGALPGSGTTELHVEKWIKNDDKASPKSILVQRYLPVLDPANPPRFLMFFQKRDDKLDAYHGVSMKSPAMVEYLTAAERAQSKDRRTALVYYGQFLDHPDEAIAMDAFVEFAKSKDDEVGHVARQMSAPRIRQLLQHPGLESDRLSLFAFMLGSCGEAKDLRVFQDLLTRPNAVSERAIDGILAGYVMLEPAEGWRRAWTIMGDDKQKFPLRFGALRMVRFFHGWKPEETKNDVLRSLGLLLADGELADMATEDLRRWKMWDLTRDVLAQFDRPSHQSMIVRKAIVRYALSCPLPEAREFVERIRSKETELVKDVQASLDLDN